MPSVEAKLTHAQSTECLRTGNPEALAKVSQQNNIGVDQRVATPFGKLNAQGEHGLSTREMSMAKDMALAGPLPSDALAGGVGVPSSLVCASC